MDVPTRSTSRQRFRSKGSDRSRLPVAVKIAFPIAGAGATSGLPIPLGSAVEGTILNDYSDAIVSAIHEHRGDVLKLIGDGTLAIFTAEDRTHACGAPLSAAIAAHERRMDRLPISSCRSQAARDSDRSLMCPGCSRSKQPLVKPIRRSRHSESRSSSTDQSKHRYVGCSALGHRRRAAPARSLPVRRRWPQSIIVDHLKLAEFRGGGKALLSDKLLAAHGYRSSRG
jgi:hypothetical protein